MRREFRAFALAAAAALLLVAPATLTFATSPLRLPFPPGFSEPSISWSLDFRKTKVAQMTRVAARQSAYADEAWNDPGFGVPETLLFQVIDIDSRFDGKRLPA